MSLSGEAATPERDAEVIVIGAGIVGAAMAYGLALKGLRVTLIDGADRDLRAARANFGLVWVQGKGMDMPPYQGLTRRSSDLWPEFAAQLQDVAAVELSYERPGGVTFCLGEEEFAARTSSLARLRAQANGERPYDTTMLDRGDLERLLPGVQLGREVSGATYCWRDGHVSPLRLLMALQAAFQRLGGTFLCGEPVQAIDPAPGRFSVRTGARKVAAPRIVLAAGNAMGSLASQIGLHIPQRPQRGQLLVTERIRPLLPIPAVPIRQTAEGSVLIGSSQEEVGFDTGTTTEVAGRMAARAVRILPALADAVIVRQWAGLRVMTPDGCPIYVESEAWPGAFAALCHSGVTLAAAHAHDVAAAIAAGTLPQTLKPFHPGRFDVPQAA